MACLNSMDETSMEFGDGSEAADDQGVLMGVNYIEKVSAPQMITDSSETWPCH